MNKNFEIEIAILHRIIKPETDKRVQKECKEGLGR
jgi:hypothetical protein